MEHQGKLTIGRFMGDACGWSIEVTDEKSGVDAIRVKISDEEFAKALGSVAFRPCSFEYRKDAPIGKIREVKDVNIPNLDYTASDALVREAVAEHEKDGWVGRDGDMRNRHRRGEDSSGNEYRRVAYTRFVDDKEDGE